LPSAPPVLFVSYTAVLGGAERVLLDCASGLGQGAIVACPEGPLEAAARDSGLQVAALRPRPLEVRTTLRRRVAAPAHAAGHAREVRRAIRRLRPAVVVGWSMRGLLSSAAALGGLRPRPALVFHHNDFLPGPVVGPAVRAAARRADRVVCASHAVARDLDLGRPVDVLHAGVDLERFAPGEPAGPGPQALFLGAIVPWKRPDLALEAVARAARELPGLRLRVAGAPLDRGGEGLLERLRERAAQADLEGRVELLGRVDDPRPELRRAACLLHSADREPYGLALVEALACGVPVVAPREGGPAEIVDESCGALYAPGDPDDAARALVSLLGDPDGLAGLRDAARARAEERFDRDQTRARYRELVAELAR
jgi:glycosyltransferase involved in cell wall biosynthesis